MNPVHLMEGQPCQNLAQISAADVAVAGRPSIIVFTPGFYVGVSKAIEARTTEASYFHKYFTAISPFLYDWRPQPRLLCVP